MKRISSYITDFEKRETQERELLKSFNEVFDAQLEPQKPEPPKNFFAKLFFRFRNKDLPTYPGLGFGNAETTSHLNETAKKMAFDNFVFVGGTAGVTAFIIFIFYIKTCSEL